MSQPNGTDRLDRIERLLENLAHRQDAFQVHIESLHANVHDLWESSQRHEAAIAAVLEASRRDGENIAALARIAEAHQRRIEDLEGGGDA